VVIIFFSQITSYIRHRWFSGRIFVSQTNAPGSIPGRCIFFALHLSSEYSSNISGIFEVTWKIWLANRPGFNYKGTALLPDMMLVKGIVIINSSCFWRFCRKWELLKSANYIIQSLWNAQNLNFSRLYMRKVSVCLRVLNSNRILILGILSRFCPKSSKFFKIPGVFRLQFLWVAILLFLNLTNYSHLNYIRNNHSTRWMQYNNSTGGCGLRTLITDFWRYFECSRLTE
jgi:hypothetical protein